MENKKSVKANLEKSKSSFLLIGMILAISFVVYAFSLKSDKDYIVKEGEGPPIIEEFPDRTNPEDEKKDDLKPEKPLPSKLIAVEILIVDSVKHTNVQLWIEGDPITFEEIVEVDTTVIIDTPTKPPILDGGPDMLRLYIAKHVVYPPEARENNIQGTVYLRFEVTRKGTVGKIEIFNKDQDELLKNASIDVIKSLPKFKPAIHNGQIVNAWFSIPISFKLN